MATQTVRLTIHLADGEPFTVEAEADGTRMRNLAGNIEKGMSANYVGFDLDGTLHLIPLHAIRRIEITPAPGSAMKHVVHDVRRVR
jgi:cytosine/adenosine deaminase-related metal-dependent hydrolase